jgi:iron(III) transport system ATP-binding protein
MAILDGGRILQVGSPREVYRRPARKVVANFIGETDFVTGTILGLEGERATVETPIGRFEGVLGDLSVRPAVGSTVTLSIRPECWKLGREVGGRNSIAGQIGEAVYLGEVAQYNFVASANQSSLKILELNPRYLGTSAGLGLFARVEPEDVVVLVD